MPPRLIDLTGRTYKRLTVLRRSRRKTNKPYWDCRCDCSTTISVLASSLREGRTGSCGCLHRDVVTRHGKHKSREYSSWQSMKGRCCNPNDTRYRHYGGRGITICARWLGSFQNFLDDMGPRPTPQHTIGRIDNDGNYESENCCWQTRQEQNQHTSRSLYLTHAGETRTMIELAQRLGIHKNTLAWRLGSGWPLARALTTRSLHR